MFPDKILGYECTYVLGEQIHIIIMDIGNSMKCARQHESGFILSIRLYYIPRSYVLIFYNIT